MKVAAQNIGVARFISDDPFTMLKMAQYGISFNLDGIWGGNMYAGGAGAILPNKITSKHNIRYVPKMNGLEIVKRIREQLDRNGYKDVEIKIIGDVPWSKMSYDTDIAPRHEHDLRDLRHPARQAGRLLVDPRRLLAGVPVLESGSRSAGRARSRCRSASAAPATAATRTRRTSTYVIEGAGKVYGDGRGGEGGGDDHLQLRRQESDRGGGDQDGALSAERGGPSRAAMKSQRRIPADRARVSAPGS